MPLRVRHPSNSGARENVTENLKQALKGAIASTAVLCLVSLAATAQDSSSIPSGSSPASATDQATPAKHHHHRASSASAGQSSSDHLSAADKDFLIKAARVDRRKANSASWQPRKRSDDVRKFGQRMVDDHSKANDQLKGIASQNGVQLSVALDAKDKDKALKDKLLNASGEQLDRTYMQRMVQDHKKDVAEFQKEANSGKDQDLRNFASQTLPTPQDHLKQAQQVKQAEIKEGGHARRGSTTANNQPSH